VRIGGYEVLSELGRGGMGVVYRARSADGHDVAVKVLLDMSPSSAAHFEREARLAAKLGEKDGFVGILDAGTTKEGPFLVMPFLPGGTLKQRLGRPLPVSEVVSLGQALASALGKAHALGIVHRDLKPANVLFSETGNPLVSDLGLAKHFFGRGLPGASRSRALTAEGSALGTPGYMAPEQLEGEREVGPRADVFSLGVILYECLAGQRPFKGASLIEYVARLARREPPMPLGSVRRDVPAWLEKTILQALSTAPFERFADGRELADELLAGALRQRKGGMPTRGGRVFPAAIAVFAVLALASGAVALRTTRTSPPPPAPKDPPPAQPTPPSVAKPEAPDPARLAHEALERARAAGSQRDWDGVLENATRAIGLDPGFAAAWSCRATARAWKGDKEGAEDDGTRAIALAPHDAQVWLDRGTNRFRFDDLQGAIADLTRAIELAPGDARAWRNRGSARAKAGDREGAIADQTRAIELAPEVPLGWLMRGAVRGQSGDLEGAAKDYERFIALAPDDAEAPSVRAWLESYRGQPGSR
jgi:serine/threonine-protein kinase